MFGFLATKNGRAGVALPFEAILALAGGLMTFLIGGISLALWGASVLWHEFAWATTFCIIVRFIVKLRNAYQEGKNS